MPVVSRVIMSAAKKQLGNRKFYALPEDYSLKTSKFRNTSLKKEDTAKLIKYIDDNVIGKNTTFAGPYGRRKDWCVKKKKMMMMKTKERVSEEEREVKRKKSEGQYLFSYFLEAR
ncbi:hypothetical protein LSTR_LSTR003160 [Laodelphax striatellus]|uniref:Uncharacterized protein n=1 Tax=Laodelphax striatellus TaxID=195883 RepID=A0A482WVQ7_LAOST|nr:hypothetical protein LSTR_LSTR003160 [Laodelphax striatellus]